MREVVLGHSNYSFSRTWDDMVELRKNFRAREGARNNLG
jgi:hypothetical protein